jgi:TPR repeat protein
MTDSANSADSLAALWERARKAAENGDVAGTLYVWRALADQGAWQAFAKIGWLYERGAEGVEKDLAKALFWYRRSVFEADDPLGHIGLGRAYLAGSGVPKDWDIARTHFEKASIKNHPEGALYVGMIHYQGLGVPKDMERARTYLEKAASGGYCFAFIPLALIAFRKGRIVQAVKLYMEGRRRAHEIARQDPNDDRLVGFSGLPAGGS